MGETVGPADAAVAVRIADRELERLAVTARPLRVRIWRGAHVAVVALILVPGAVGRALDGRWLAAAWLTFVAGMILWSLVRGKRRLERQVGLLTRARAGNAALLGQEPGSEV